MARRFRYESKAPEWRKNMSDDAKAMQRAATVAVTQTATLARDNARKNIASAGFSSRWQKGMRFRMEKRPPDTFAAAQVFHSIGFAIVFELGATIRGKPKLWIPIEANLPVGIRTPKKYVQRVGPLVSVNRPGKNPLLFAKPVAKPKSQLSPERRARLAQIKQERSTRPPAQAQQEMKPLFVGVDTVTIRKRFAIYDAIRDAAKHTEEFYDAAMSAEGQ